MDGYASRTKTQAKGMVHMSSLVHLLLHPNHVVLGLLSTWGTGVSECTVLLRGDVEANFICSFLYTVNGLYYLNSFGFWGFFWLVVLSFWGVGVGSCIVLGLVMFFGFLMYFLQSKISIFPAWPTSSFKIAQLQLLWTLDFCHYTHLQQAKTWHARICSS